ncbi:MAG: cytochrome P460 family protein [Gammaproteobacteria bacterium]|jgi:hypothetical protein
MKKIIFTFIALSASLLVYAGGNPEHVSFPEAYKTEFIQYDTRNRVNGKQLAVMYANEIAINSIKDGKLAAGSKIIMEIHKAKLDADGNKITNDSGLFEQGKFAAVAVMEKKSDWDSSFSAKDRAGNWGFAIYNTDGSPKENKLECAACHIPLSGDDYMFSFQSLSEFNK